MFDRLSVTNPPTTPPFGSGNGRPAVRVWWRLSTTLGALVLIFLLWRCGGAVAHGRAEATAAVEHFHDELNGGDYLGILGNADEGFGAGQGQAELIRVFEAIHRKLGAGGLAALLNFNFNVSLRGTFFTGSYGTAYSAHTATATFTWIERGGRFKLFYYNIESKTLILN